MENINFIILFLSFHCMVKGNDLPCDKQDCEKSSVPLLNNIRAPLYAEFDTTEINKQLKVYIDTTVERVMNKMFMAKSENVISQKIDTLKATMLKEFSDTNTNTLSTLKSSFLTDTKEWKRNIDEQNKNLFKTFQQDVTTLRQKMDTLSSDNMKVALTVCGGGGSINGGDVIKFTTARTSHGISDINAVTSTGKFTCEKPGFYVLSVFIMSHSTQALYKLYKNSNIISFVSIVGKPNESNDYHTGSGTVVLQLNAGDTLYVKAYERLYFHGGHSCFTVIKI